MHVRQQVQGGQMEDRTGLDIEFAESLYRVKFYHLQIQTRRFHLPIQIGTRHLNHPSQCQRPELECLHAAVRSNQTK